MPRLRSESMGGGDMTWLGSLHGIENARTAVLDVSTFTKATHYPDGYFRAGTPVNAASEAALKPWTGANGEKLGFLARDIPTDGTTDTNAPVLRHGTIVVANLPGGALAAGDTSNFVIVN